MVKVQKCLGASTFLMFEGSGYGLTAFVMGFYYEPEVSGITLATLPLLVISFGVMAYIMDKGGKTVSAAYGKAGGTATEALFAMRTVVSLGMEKHFERKYSTSLSGARKATVRNGVGFGVGVGCALSAYLIMMGAAVVYGAYRLAGEMEASEFDFVVPLGNGSFIHYCANTTNVLTDAAMSGTSSQSACMAPSLAFKMSCQTAYAFSQVEDGVQGLGFRDADTFRTFLKDKAPKDYVADNSQYFGCMLSNTDVLLAIFAIMMAGEGLSMAGSPAAVFNEGRVAAARILAIINRIPAIDSFSEEGLKPEACRGEVHVSDVVFAYPTAVDHTVCRGFSLHIPAGTSMALCGASGSGKSTLIQLLERFYDPLSGAITLDGVDIKSLNVRWLRSQLGLVGQEPVLFQGTVAQNIAYGKLTPATQEEIEKAARAANAHAFITENLQNGYDTEVGLKGGRLSGGQKQRVAIARALIKQPAILLLDEATSALDNQSEAVVQAAIDEVMKTQRLTTIIIAHRLSTIRNADAIAVLNEGKVLEQGTHQQLLALQGLYSSLVLSQS
jgi:ATP-binding cassette subfamily B (MDR/TAP) protein 1